MIVYANTKSDFVNRASNGMLADHIETLVKDKLHRSTGEAEKRSWENSLGRMGLLLAQSRIPDDAGVAIEYTIPMSSKRIDILISGYDDKDVSQVVIVELKQWQELSSIEGSEALVETRVGGTIGPHPHPSYQAWSYAQMMHNFSAVVQDKNVDVRPCAYLHNYIRKENDPIDAIQYHYYEDLAPAFTKADAEKLKDFISRYVKKGDEAQILYEIENGELRPSKSLQDALASMLDGNKEFVMIDEQRVVYDAILKYARKARQMREKEVLIVKGGPGTGKSVIAINALVELIKDGQLAQYVTKNSAPRAVFKEKLRGLYSSRTKKRYTNAYIDGIFKGSGCYVESEENEIGTIIVDEAHRLNEKSGMFHNLGENQIKEIINACYCSVFFIDEHQQVTTSDAGSISEIERFAKDIGVTPRHFKLVSQFRCNGSDGYLSWLDNILYGEETAHTDLRAAKYDFKVVDSPKELQRIIENRNDKGVNARIVAGYCWEWNADGRNDSNVHDINIGDFGISWNLGNSQTWAIDKDSVKEAGCIHTCQGLEFEHVGVIIGEDMFMLNGEICTDFTKRASTDQSIRGLRGMLRKNPGKAKIIGDALIRNTYRTLMTRGSKSCTVYCCDKALGKYLKERADIIEPIPLYDFNAAMVKLRIMPEIADAKKFESYLPYYEMKAACGYFGEGEPVDMTGWVKVDGVGRLTRNMFVVKACGESMSPRIHDGDLCVFRANPAGTRQGKILLVQHRSVYDPDNAGAFSIKQYSSKKSYDEQGDWQHEQIVLHPLNSEYEDIVINNNDDEQFRVIAELISVLR